MKKARILSFALFLMILLSSGLYYYANHSTEREKIQISTNPWIGFTPFIYAQEKGWLEETPFEFIWLVDLSDNARMYERGFTQGFTATQYELLHFKDPSRIKPVFLIDRSYGADAIVSNLSLDQIRSFKESIDVYLEQGSLNDDFFDAFMRENQLNPAKFHKIDASQNSISILQSSGKPIIIISYQPYLSGLLKRGFHPLSSTRNMETFFVIDALFVDEKRIIGREEEFVRLQQIFERSLAQLHKNPQEFYATVQGYLEGQSYDEFILTTTQIQWLDGSNRDQMVEHLHNQNIQTDRLLP